MRYTLMHKSLPVAEMTLDDFLGIIVSVDKLYNAEHLPIGISVMNDLPDSEKLKKWWKHRAIPMNRTGLRDILQELMLPTAQALAKESYGFSLSDQYWIWPKNSELEWKYFNFFHNDFSEDAGMLLFGDEIKSDYIDLFSPDNTTDGCLRKRWGIINGQRCLIKGGSNPFHQEPLNEVLASMLLNRLNVTHTNYNLTWENDLPYSVCANFTTSDTELVTAYQICEALPFAEGGDLYEHFINCCDMLGVSDMRDSLDRMITLDFIITNSDRHYGNFGAIRNADTLEWIGPAPLFDNGTSLWCKAVNWFIDPEAEQKSVTFYQQHEEQLALVNSFDWLDINALNGIADEFSDIFSSSPFIDEERKYYLYSALMQRIELLSEFIQVQEQTRDMELL